MNKHKMSSKDTSYGIFIRNDLLKEATRGQHQKTVLLGQIVKIEGISPGENYVVRCLRDNEQWESVTFCCSQNNVLPISEKMYPFLAAIASPQHKVKLARNREKCENLMNITKDMVVGFADTDGIYLGIVKYIGKVKGMGECFGIQLHEKKKGNNCSGSCAGIQYFNCLPGYGIFTTIDRIEIINKPLSCQESKKKSDLDIQLERNISNMTNGVENSIKFNDICKPKYEEIVTKYGEYNKANLQPNLNGASHNTNSYMRSSLSLQNILDVGNSTVNTNNDFDQNTIIQPDRTYLMNDLHRKHKNKSEMDLIEVIGSWSTGNNIKQSDTCVTLRKPSKHDNFVKANGVENNTHYTISRAMRNKSINPLSHILDGSAFPRKSKSLAEHADHKERSELIVKKSEDTCRKLNERNEAPSKPSTSGVALKSKYLESQPGTTNDITVGTLVEVLNDVSKEPLYGVVRWIGTEKQSNFTLVGVELEDEQSHLPLSLTDGVHNGERLFSCPEKRGLFVPLHQCHKDSRFQDGIPTPIHQVTDKHFGKNAISQYSGTKSGTAGTEVTFTQGVECPECPVIKGAVAPLCMPTEEDVEAVCGKYRGIQGHHNSCYLDVTLFSMFTYTCVFDSLLFRPKGPNDIDDYDEVQRVLREEIINPLRKNLFVSADHVMNLRKLLDRLSSVSGLTSEEKDPEEFLNSLLAQILKAEPFLKLNSGQESFYYQLFVEKDADLTLPTVQQLFEQSFLTSNIKLKEVPACMILQMPRFGKSYKMYPRILPSQLLDVTDVIEGSPRQCIVCGKLARWECRECFDDCSNTGLESTAFCDACLKTAHRHERRTHHKPVVLEVTYDYAIFAEHCRPPRLYMELFAVICIETSHYVAFVKCGVGHEAPWCFFDSMADRKGEKHGYNIPEMVACPDISKWLSDEQLCRQLHEESQLDRHLPEHARRLLCDAYICMYQSSDVMMYR